MHAAAASDATGGLVALGDSITRAGGAGVADDLPYRSWAAWLADALDLSLTNLALDGASSAGVLATQVPQLAGTDGSYSLATVYVGVNDARSAGWDPDAFAEDAHAILAAITERARRVLVLTLPLDLGRPPCAPKPAAANEILRDAATFHEALVVDLDRFGGERLVRPDAVHPTALGQLAIAERAARALGMSILGHTSPATSS